MPRRRNPLVCQYTENLSSAALEAYADIVRDIVGRRHGVYALYRRDKLYYVGLRPLGGAAVPRPPDPAPADGELLQPRRVGT